MVRAFIAGPLFSEAERRMLETIAAEVAALGFDVFLPHRDAGLVDWAADAPPTVEALVAVYRADREALLASGVVVAWVDGADVDSGTCIELGIAHARGIPVFALRTDPRPFINAMIVGVCGEGRTLFRSLDALTRALGRFRDAGVGAEERPS